ncbi:hypothetical protein KAS50_03735, partial [bacterium]|nr:hypothetical protein [bacterium]
MVFILFFVIQFVFIGCTQKKHVGEFIDRGVIALTKGPGEIYVGWRLLKSDAPDAGFNVYRKNIGKEVDYKKINDEPVTASTNYTDKTARTRFAYRYKVKAIINGKEEDTPGTGYAYCVPWDKPYISIQFDGDYDVHKVGVGDLDGDGAYDYVIQQPNFNTDPYYRKGYWKRSKEPYKLEAYDSKGKFMWRYDMGWAIETGTWYAPYMVYDIDGDGCAEVYTKAGEGDPRELGGRVIEGPEYLVKLDGKTGRVIKRIPWISREGYDNYNHSQRHFLAVAYLDGKLPSLIMQRGTYTIIKTESYDANLNQIWHWEASGEDKNCQGQGQHGLISADVDGDGCDELVIGSPVLDNDGKLLWNVKLGHPDVCYVADINPNHPGLEVFYGIEPGRDSNGVCLVSAKDGKILWGYEGRTKHVHGKGMIGDFDTLYPGMECYAREQDGSQSWIYAADGKRLTDMGLETCSPKALWWDADSQKEIIERGKLFEYNGDMIMEIEGNVMFVGDILGDWREEIITSLKGEL